MVETKFGGPPIVINHNIVPVFKLSDNLSLQTNFVMKQVIILTGNVGRCEFFLFPRVGHRCFGVKIASRTIISDGFFKLALSEFQLSFD